MYTIVSVIILEISYILTTKLHQNIKKKCCQWLRAILEGPGWVGGGGGEEWARASPYMPKYSLNDHK